LSDIDSSPTGASDDESGIEPVVLPYLPFASFSEWVAPRIDFSTFDKFSQQLEVSKSEATPKALADAVSTASKWAAINTGAIEGLYEVDRGFTYTVAVSAAVWNDIHKLKGDAAANSIQDAIEAYDFVLDAVTHSRPITEVWIRDLHSIVTRSQDVFSVITEVGVQQHELPKGVYKTHPNSPLNISSNTVHSYAPPIDTPNEMARLIEELRTEAFQNAHPVLQGAFAHYAFVSVHPFSDGNGRVSRALASVFTYRRPGVPLVIFADQKSDYIDALELADRGDFRTFIRFISERIIDTVQMVRAEMAKSLVPDVSTQMAGLAPVLLGKQGLAHTEIDAISLRVLDVFAAALDARLAAASMAPPMVASVQRDGTAARTPPTGYRLPPGDSRSERLRVMSEPPAAGIDTRRFGVAIARPDTDGADFVIYSSQRTVLEVDLREVHPTVGAALVFRAEAEAEREIREAVAVVAASGWDSLRKAGYL